MITAQRFLEISARYSGLQIAIVGDFCLDRYLEIDPARRETSIETGLEVYNVANVRSQPGGAGTILNNLLALGVGTVHAVGFCGEDGEGYELRRALERRQGVRLDHFIQTPLRRTFTYTKPLVLEPGSPPRELNRLDMKNWSPTPSVVERHIAEGIQALFKQVDAVILLDQVDIPNTGVVTEAVLGTIGCLAEAHPEKLILGDSRGNLKKFPAVGLKMNRAELALLAALPCSATVEEAMAQAATLARQKGRDVMVTLSEDGIIGAEPTGEVWRVAAHPVRGEIDIVGAGDSVTANLSAALAAGASLPEALEISMAASSIVIHQLGTTGSAEPREIAGLLRS